MDDGLICDRCHAGRCWDCEGHCWHGCVTTPSPQPATYPHDNEEEDR